MDPETLRSVPLFRDTRPEVLELIAQRGRVRAWPSGSVIWRAGEAPKGLHVLLEGRVRIVRERGGREVVLHHAEAGATLGEIPLFDGGGYPATLITESAARLLVIQRPLLEAAIRQDPGIAFALLETLGRRVREVSARLEAVTTGAVRSRLVRHLLERNAAGGGGDFTLGMTQAALARELGTVREVVARCLTALVSEGGLVRVGRARYRIRDRRRLGESAFG